MEYHIVNKVTLQRKEIIPELEQELIALKLCREANDVLWTEILSQQAEENKILESKEGKKLQYEIRRKLAYD